MTAIDRRRRNVAWCVNDEKGDLYSAMRDGVKLAVLMDIRDELVALNEKLGCYRVRDALDAVYRLDRRLARRFPLKGGRRGR